MLVSTEVYRGPGVREVWIYRSESFRVLELTGGHYVAIAASKVLPELDLSRLVPYLQMSDQHIALRQFRDELRASA